MTTLKKIGCRALLLPLLLVGTAATASVDDILAQFPANDAAQANKLFDALLGEGEGAIAGLCGQLVPLGAGDDNAIRFALNGLARYTSRPGAGHYRAVVEEALLEGLEDAKNPEVQAFLLRQLQQCGGNETVSEIGELVVHSAVSSHAILALDTIDTWRARRTLTKALNKTEGDTQLEILSALADEGSNWRAVQTIRKRLAGNPPAGETVHLLSILVEMADDNAHRDLIAAMDREEPRIRKAALAYAAPMMDRYAVKKWEKKTLDKDLPDEVKREIGNLLAGCSDCE